MNEGAKTESKTKVTVKGDTNTGLGFEKVQKQMEDAADEETKTAMFPAS